MSNTLFSPGPCAVAVILACREVHAVHGESTLPQYLIDDNSAFGQYVKLLASENISALKQACGIGKDSAYCLGSVESVKKWLASAHKTTNENERESCREEIDNGQNFAVGVYCMSLFMWITETEREEDENTLALKVTTFFRKNLPYKFVLQPKILVKHKIPMDDDHNTSLLQHFAGWRAINERDVDGISIGCAILVDGGSKGAEDWFFVWYATDLKEYTKAKTEEKQNIVMRSALHVTQCGFCSTGEFLVDSVRLPVACVENSTIKLYSSVVDKQIGLSKSKINVIKQESKFCLNQYGGCSESKTYVEVERSIATPRVLSFAFDRKPFFFAQCRRVGKTDTMMIMCTGFMNPAKL